MRNSLILLLSLASACSAPSPTPYALDPDTSLYVDHTGAWELEHEGQTLLRSAESGAITGHQYEMRITSAVGFWNFRRTGEEVSTLRPTQAHRQLDNGTIEIDYGGAGTLKVRRETSSVLFAFEPASVENYSSFSIPFVCDDEATYLGFGAQYNRSNQRGHAFDLWVQEQGIGRTGTNEPILGGEYHSYFPMPYWLDLRGFGVLFETSARVHADLCSTDPDVARIEVQDGGAVRWRVFTSGDAPTVIRDVGEHLGRPSALPSWAYDLWIGAQGGREAIEEVADSLTEAEVPVGALWVQDWTGRQDFGLGNFGVRYRWVADDAFYPELPQMIANLRGRGIRFLGYANPFVVEGLGDHFPEMSADGLLIRDGEGAPYLMTTPNGRASLPDLTNPATRAYVRGFLREMVQTIGMDGWMVDFGEWLPHDASLFDGSSAALAHNLYPTEWHRLSREIMQEARPDGDFALFSRSGWTGEQGVAQVVWIGDQEADFSERDGLPTVVPALLNMGISAVPFVTHDVGGFSGGPRDREVMIRWTELGAFTPIMRTHEGLRREENHAWNSDPETLGHFRRLVRVHAALRPEFEALEAEAVATSMPPIRHLALHFPEDRETYDIHDTYLLGADLLVAPILEEGATRRSVYLPAGEWYHIWTGTQHQGPAHIEVDAPLGSPPVFSRGRDRPDLRAIE